MLVGNNTNKLSSISMANFVFLKAFGVTIKPPRAPNIIEVLWTPHLPNWYKFNYDGAFRSITNETGYGRIFRNYKGDFLIAYVVNLILRFAEVGASFGSKSTVCWSSKLAQILV